VVGILVFSPFLVHAEDVAQTTLSTANLKIPFASTIIGFILYLLQYIAGLLLKLAAFLVGAALGFNKLLLDFSGVSSFIYAGWTIFRDIANLGFVLGIIVIAMATIVRYRSYSAQQILLRLIVAALLVNFSLVMAGAFITVSNSFSDYFVNSISGDGKASGVSIKLTQSLGIPDIIEGDSSPESTLQKIKDAVLGVSLFVLGGLAINVVFLSLMAIAMVAVAGMLLLRYFYLAFLLILSPVVFLMWVFPGTRTYATQWWKKFIHWILFAPTLLFFLWLALTVSTRSQDIIRTTADTFAVPAGQDALLGHLKFGSLMISIISIALLLGGLKVAQSMGYGGTKLAMSASSSIGNWAKNKATRGLKRAGGVALKPLETGLRGAAVLSKKYNQNPPKTKLGRIGKAVVTLGVPALSATMGSFAASVGTQSDKMQAVSYEHWLKQYEHLTDDRLKDLAKSQSGADRNAVLALLAKRKKLDGDTIESVGGADLVLDLEERFKAASATKDFSEIEKAVGMSRGIRDATKELADAFKKSGGQTTEAITKLQEKLKKASDKFLSSLGEKDWKEASSILRKKPSDLTGAQEIYRQQVAQFINNDVSGRPFYKSVGGLNSEEMVDLVSGLVNEAHGVHQITGDDHLVEVLNAAKKTGDFREIIDLLENSSSPMHQRLAKRIRKTILDDATALFREEKKDKDKKEEAKPSPKPESKEGK